MLPTLGFILCAYGIYALTRVWTRRHRRQFRSFRQVRRRRRLTLAGGTGVGVGIVILISILGLPPQYENLRSASIISASWGQDPGVAGQAMARQEILPIKTQGDSGQPAYAYLHPETPPVQMLPEKNAPPSWPKKKPRLRKVAPRAKAQKTVAKAPTKKDKAPSKPGAKKKKPHLPIEKLAANAG
ncbi:MAG: hypothetical protein HY790_10100 [Deltaproteobacteria bacterium]|nr:hypothetical protein [Deltaproteobacteria bacterium]